MGLRVCTLTLCTPDGLVSKVLMRKMSESGDSGPLRPNKVLIYFEISVSEAAEQRGWRLLVATCSYLPLVAATLYSHTHCFFLVHIFISSSVAGGRVSNDLSLEMGGS